MKLRLPLTLLVAFLPACGGSGNPRYSLEVGGDDAGGGGFAASDAAPGQGLDAYIEQGQVAVKLVTLACSGACATVQAVGIGGSPPYAYKWEDGSTNPVRQVCPSSDTSYAVTITDSGQAGELATAAQSAQATVTADVIACPDGGAQGPSTVYWATWTGGTTGSSESVPGVLTPPGQTVQVTYAGGVYALQTSSGTNEFTPAATFVSATVANAPPGPGIIEFGGSVDTSDSVTFSQPIVNPLVAIVSLGTGSLDTPSTLYFTEPFVVLSSGVGPYGAGYWGNGNFTVADGGLTAIEGNGVIQFQGTFSALHWTDPTSSVWTGITVGMRAP